MEFRDDDRERQQVVKTYGFLNEEEDRYVLFEHPLPPTLPDGFLLRSLMGEQEVAAYTKLHRATFESMSITPEWRARTLHMPTYRPELDLVVSTPNGELAGFYVGWFEPSRRATRAVSTEFEGWTSALTALITDGETAPLPRMIYALPHDHRWNCVPGVTLLGDAAHVMPPVGDGANLAMFDGAELGKAIAVHPDDIEAALTAYEEALFPRSESFAVTAQLTIGICFDDRAPFGLIDVLTGAPEGEHEAHGQP